MGCLPLSFANLKIVGEVVLHRRKCQVLNAELPTLEPPRRRYRGCSLIGVALMQLLLSRGGRKSDEGSASYPQLVHSRDLTRNLLIPGILSSESM